MRKHNETQTAARRTLLGAKGIATSSKKLLGAPGLTTSSKDATSFYLCSIQFSRGLPTRCKSCVALATQAAQL